MTEKIDTQGMSGEAVKDGNLEDMYDVPFEVVEDAYPDIQWGGRS